MGYCGLIPALLSLWTARSLVSANSSRGVVENMILYWINHFQSLVICFDEAVLVESGVCLRRSNELGIKNESTVQKIENSLDRIGGRWRIFFGIDRFMLWCWIMV